MTGANATNMEKSKKPACGALADEDQARWDVHLKKLKPEHPEWPRGTL